ncbi:MAG: 6-bladed beta-propeller [Parabacteroides sp.]
MKRTFLFLVSAAVLLGIQQGYERFSSSNEPVSPDEMELSSIAEQVIAIPLHTRNGQSIKTARDIHQEGKNLFLISNDILYRFDRKGDFICQITRPEEIHVAGYVVSPATQQVIVLGNTNDIFYYSYGGKLLTKKKLKSDLTHHRMLSVTEYQNKIYSVEENVSAAPSTPEPTRQQEVVEYDTTFQRIKSRPLRITQSTSQTLPASFAPHLALANGSFYAYEAPNFPTANPRGLSKRLFILCR